MLSFNFNPVSIKKFEDIFVMYFLVFSDHDIKIPRTRFASLSNLGRIRIRNRILFIMIEIREIVAFMKLSWYPPFKENYKKKLKSLQHSNSKQKSIYFL